MPATTQGSGSLPHAHVLLASAGIALLGFSGLAGSIFLVEYRSLKSKHPVTIYGGIWDNNWHMQIYGPLGSRYYIPYAVGLTITGLDR